MVSGFSGAISFLVAQHEYWGRILTTINHVKDPAVLDALEIIVEAYQSQTTLDILAESNSPSVPANWDEDLIAAFR